MGNLRIVKGEEVKFRLFGRWLLGFVWSLEFGNWDFHDPGINH
jgi:hypothetical protein